MSRINKNKNEKIIKIIHRSNLKGSDAVLQLDHKLAG